MHVKRRRLEDFESRSVALFSTVLVSMALAASARAQTPPSMPSGTRTVPSMPIGTRTTPTTPLRATPTGELSVPRAPVADASKLQLTTAQVQQAFQTIDTNGDGSISRAEVSAFPRIERHFDRIDANHDGSVSPDEFGQALQRAS